MIEKVRNSYIKNIIILYIRLVLDTQDEYRNEELVNDIFLKIFKNINKFENKGSFEGWMRTLIKFTAINFIKLKINDKYNTISFEKDLTEVISKESITYNDNNYIKYDFSEFEHINNVMSSSNNNMLLADEILGHVEKLPKATAKVVKLVIEGFSYKEIMKQLGISDGTYKWHLSKGREKLRALIV